MATILMIFTETIMRALNNLLLSLQSVIAF